MKNQRLNQYLNKTRAFIQDKWIIITTYTMVFTSMLFLWFSESTLYKLTIPLGLVGGGISTTAEVAETLRKAGRPKPSGGAGPVLPLAHPLAEWPAEFTAHTCRSKITNQPTARHFIHNEAEPVVDEKEAQRERNCSSRFCESRCILLTQNDESVS